MTILINYTGKFCYRHGNFQSAEAVIKVFLKMSQNSQENTYARAFIKQGCRSQASKYESLYMIEAVHS